MDLFAELVDAADACRSDDAEHWKNNGRDDEADERWQCVRAGLKAEKRREDEISRAEKHGKQSDAQKEQIFVTDLVHGWSPFL